MKSKLPLLALLLLTSCGPKGSRVVGDVVDCTAPTARDLVKQFGPTLDLVLARAATTEGSIDWQSVRAASQNFALDAGACVLATTVARVLADKPNPDAPNSAPLEIDKTKLREGFEVLRSGSFGGKRFHTEAGDL